MMVLVEMEKEYVGRYSSFHDIHIDDDFHEFFQQLVIQTYLKIVTELLTLISFTIQLLCVAFQ
jgi:hypothetical protein